MRTLHPGPWPLLPVVLALLTVSAAPGPARWPSFRGVQAAGVGDGANLPDRWDLAAGTNIKWRTPLPGLAHSSPIVWGDQIFVTTAVSSQAGATFKKGLYGAGDASLDRSEHQWQLIAIDRATGAIQWTRTAYRGLPRSYTGDAVTNAVAASRNASAVSALIVKCRAVVSVG